MCEKKLGLCEEMCGEALSVWRILQYAEFMASRMAVMMDREAQLEHVVCLIYWVKYVLLMVLHYVRRDC